jgi:hypothetical protein
MKKILPPAIIAIALFALSGLSIARAQKVDPTLLPNPIWYPPVRAKLLAGPRMSITRNFHSGGFRAGDGTACIVLTDGSGWGYAGGLTAEYIAGRNWSIIPAISYESRPGSFRQRMPDLPVLLEGTTLPVNQSIEAISDIDYRIISAEVLYKYELVQPARSVRLSVAAGPAADLVTVGRKTQVQDLINPDNARFIEGSGIYPNERYGRRQVFAKNDAIGNLNRTRFSLKGGVQAEVGLFNDAIIMYPGIFCDYGLTRVSTGENWNLTSLLFQLDFRRAL